MEKKKQQILMPNEQQNPQRLNFSVAQENEE